jgi:glucosamine-6-phosphate deaminase
LPIQVLVTRDFEQMSEVAAEKIRQRMQELQRSKDEIVLGLATGNSPTGVYARMAAAANRCELDSLRWRTFNLDEYIGLTAREQAGCDLHPQSFRSFMNRHLFELLDRSPRATFVPQGGCISEGRLAEELELHPEDWESRGTSSGRAILIDPKTDSEYLRWVRCDILDAYADRIREAGGIDLQVLGVGGRGHVAFHEAGIPFELPGLLLVELDRVTREHAVADGYFKSLDDCPRHALTMSLRLVFEARDVIVLANGSRKTNAITRALLSDPSPAMPMSYAQLYAAGGGRVTFVLDEIAAAGLLGAPEETSRRGIQLDDLR